MLRSFLNPVFVLAFAVALPRFATAQPQAGMFPFVIPWDDASKNATDVSFLNPAPLTEQRRIRASNGHFFDATGRRVRFLGANFVFGANFPDKENAEKIAARMHKYGFNMVRLHHMDGRNAPMGLWNPQFPDMQHLDAGQLDRLDYLVAQLKKNGIYVDLNLHVSRKFTVADGFPDADVLPGNGKVTAWFEPRMIDLQKQFAREMLSHRNPYTNQTYAQDPAVALVEIHNEDSLLDSARDGRIAKLPIAYQKQLVAGWNAFLQQKHKATPALVAAWNGGAQTPGPNLISNAHFSDGTTGWILEKTAPAQGHIEAEDVVGQGTLPSGRALHLRTDATSATAWHLQTNYNGLDLQEGQRYNLKFWARSNAPRSLTVYTKTDHEPWRDVGLRQSVALTPQWKRYELNFVAQNTLPQHNRLTFVMGEAIGDAWIADLQLRTGFELPQDQSLEQGNIELTTPSSAPWGEDYTRYLMEVERIYAEGMRDYIKKDLGTRALVTCSQASYGGLAGVWRESNMDFVDMHAYWQHPSFPNTPWDPQDWLIRNTPMVSDANFGTLPNLAMNRVAGKPFTVSEYNHPAPNSFSAETLPLIMSYAAWQDWDGVFLFDYNSSRDQWSSDKIQNFFSVGTHPAKMAFLPASAALFLRGTPPQAAPQTLKVPVQSVLPLAAASGNTRDVWKAAGVTSQDVLKAGLQLQFVPDGVLRVESNPIANSNNALQWSPTDGQFTYVAPQAQLAVTRSAPAHGAMVDLGDWKYEIANSQLGFAALALFSRDEKPIRQSQSLLLTVVGNVENANMGWNADRTSVGNRWGNGPALAEGITGRITINTPTAKTTIYALDGMGNRAQVVPSQWDNGELQFAIGPQYKTLWYEIAATPD